MCSVRISPTTGTHATLRITSTVSILIIRLRLRRRCSLLVQYCSLLIHLCQPTENAPIAWTSDPAFCCNVDRRGLGVMVTSVPHKHSHVLDWQAPPTLLRVLTVSLHSATTTTAPPAGGFYEQLGFAVLDEDAAPLSWWSDSLLTELSVPLIKAAVRRLNQRPRNSSEVSW